MKRLTWLSLCLLGFIVCERPSAAQTSESPGLEKMKVVKFEDDDHFTQKWTWQENGEEKIETFHFIRKKSS